MRKLPLCWFVWWAKKGQLKSEKTKKWDYVVFHSSFVTPLREQHPCPINARCISATFKNMEFGGFVFCLSMKIRSFLSVRAWDGISGMLITVLALFCPSL